MIRFQNKLREMRTYEIPVQAGAGLVRQKVDIVRRKLVQAGEGQPQGSLSVQTHRESVERTFPVSLTLTAYGTKGDTSEPLPDRLEHVEPFKSAIAARRLVVLPVAEAKSEASAAPETTPLKGHGKSESARLENQTGSEASAPTDQSKTEKPADAGTTTKKQRGGQ